MCRPLRQAVVPIRFVPGNLVTPFQLTPVHLYRLMSREADATAYGQPSCQLSFHLDFNISCRKEASTRVLFSRT
jgi:hypothetical protein